MWNDLELKDKARMIQLAVKSGIKDLSTIQEVYNKFAEGGPFEDFLSALPNNQSMGGGIRRNNTRR